VFKQPSHPYTASLIAASTMAAETPGAPVRPV
jgi:ABC-type dipeptide/oligopeptide/nickel transport system ATPase component